MEPVDGLQLQCDAVIGPSGSLVDCNVTAEFAERSRGGATIWSVTTSLVAKPGAPFLVSRWQQGEANRLLVGTLGLAQKTSGKAGSHRFVYVDAVVYESAADAQAQRNPVARVVFPTRSGQLAQAKIGVPVPGGLEPLGLVAKIDPVLDATGTAVDLISDVSYVEKGSGQERLASGERVPRQEIRAAQIKATVANGTSEVAEMQLSSAPGAPSKPSGWQAATGCSIVTIE